MKVLVLPKLPVLVAVCLASTGCSFIRTRPIERTEKGQVVCSNSRVPAYVDMGIGLAMHAALAATALSPEASRTTVSLASFGQLLPVVLVLPSMIHGFAQAGRCSRAQEQWRAPPPPVAEPLRDIPTLTLPPTLSVPPGCDAADIQRAGVGALRRSGLEVARPLISDPEPVSAWRPREPASCGRIQFTVLGGPSGLRIQTELELSPSPRVGCPEPRRLSAQEQIWLYRIREHLTDLLEQCRAEPRPAAPPSEPSTQPSDLPRNLQL